MQRRPKNNDKDYTEIEIGNIIRTIFNKYIININLFPEHSTNTSLNLVGLQIWRGALLLSDWLICNSKKFDNESRILELGSGVGLTSIVASMFKPVLCTGMCSCLIIALTQ